MFAFAGSNEKEFTRESPEALNIPRQNKKTDDIINRQYFISITSRSNKYLIVIEKKQQPST